MTHSLTLAARLGAAAALAFACGLLTACGSAAAPGSAPTRTVTVQAAASSSATSAAPATSSPSVSSPSAAAPGPSGCLASGLQAAVGSSQGAAGTIYSVIVLTNTSNATCTLYGYPGVSFVTGVGGAQVGLPATKDPVVAKTLVTLAPGGQAAFLLGVHDVGAIPGCKITGVDWLRIYPPGDYGSINVQDKTQACTNGNLSIMTVSPVRSGASPSF
jgi:Protein of unknown function (DUF4232)